MGGKSLSGNGSNWFCVSPCVSTTVTSSRGGTTLLFLFFAYLTVVGIFANSQQEQQEQQLSLNFPLIFHSYSQHRHHYQRAKGAEAKAEANGRQREGRTYCFYFITAKAGKEGGIRDLAGGNKNSFASFPIWFFPSFRDQRGGVHSLTAVDSEEDGGEKRWAGRRKGKKRKERKDLEIP